jgi:hypothetical protein
MPKRPRRMRATAVACAAAACGALLASCASIPTSGPVRQGVGVNSGVQANQVVGVIAQPPRPGMTPQEVVEGFLLAGASFDGDHSVARSYLTSEASSAWNPSAGVTIYNNARGPEPVPVVGDRLTFTAPRIATITSQGSLTPAGGTVTAVFTVRKVDGQWRISALAPGLLLTQADVTREYQSFNLYFPVPDQSSTILVPEQVFVPRGSGQSTSLVEALLSGPSNWLAPAVHTAFPPGTKLAVNSAPIQDGTVDVDLTPQAGSAAGKQAEAMTAQLVWTLGQLNVTSVRILVGGSAARVVSVEDPRYSKWNPDGASQQSTAYFVRDGRLMSIQPGHVAPVPGPSGDGAIRIAHPGISYDQTQMAALFAGGTQVVAGKIGLVEHIVKVKQGLSFTAPSWDVFGLVWFVDRRPAATGHWSNVFWSYSAAQGAVQVAVESLPAGKVLAFRVSPDGARAAVLMSTSSGTAVYLARVVRTDRGQTLSGFRLVTTRLVGIQGVSWASADNLLVLGSSVPGGALEPTEISLTGSIVQSEVSIPASSGATSEIAQVSQAASQPVVASTTDGKVWVYSGSQWQPIGRGADAVYPG